MLTASLFNDVELELQEGLRNWVYEMEPRRIKQDPVLLLNVPCQGGQARL